MKDFYLNKIKENVKFSAVNYDFVVGVSVDIT